MLLGRAFSPLLLPHMSVVLEVLQAESLMLYPSFSTTLEPRFSETMIRMTLVTWCPNLSPCVNTLCR